MLCAAACAHMHRFSNQANQVNVHQNNLSNLLVLCRECHNLLFCGLQEFLYSLYTNRPGCIITKMIL